MSFQVTQDKCTILDSFNPGDEIRVQFNLRGREWNGPQGIKYFNTLEAWRIERAAGGGTGNQQQSSQPQDHGNQNNQAPVFNSSISDNDDLPFYKGSNLLININYLFYFFIIFDKNIIK